MTLPPRPILVRVFRRSVAMIYWIVLPIAAMLTLGWIVSTALRPSDWKNWQGLFALIAFTGVVAWRLWLYRRAAGLTGPLPSGSRLLKFFLPLGVLAVGGLLLLALGLSWVAVGLSLRMDARYAMDVQVQQTGWIQIGLGVVLASVGTALCWPFWRRLLGRHPSQKGQTETVVASAD